MAKKTRNHRRKLIRYFRWSVKAAFLLIFTIPIAYLLNAPTEPVYSITTTGLTQPLFMLPLGQAPCVTWNVYYGYIDFPMSWLICPVGGLQTFLTGQVDLVHLVPTLVALLVFLIPIFVLGNIFCGWICPLGSIIDSFDKAIETFAKRFNEKREQRFFRSKDKEAAKDVSLGVAACPTCPFGRFLKNKFGGSVANGILVSSLVGSAVFRLPVFCAICPIGITSRGMFHLKAITNLTSFTGTLMPIIIELWAIPAVAVLTSLREKRYWCRKICPVGATLYAAGSFSPLLKPKVQADKCVMKECPKTCEDYHLDYCGACRQLDRKKCERVCPQGINLVEGGSLAKCVKCFECYIECERGALTVEKVGNSEAIATMKRFFRRKNPKPPQQKT